MDDGEFAAFQLSEATGPLVWQPPCCGGHTLWWVYQSGAVNHETDPWCQHLCSQSSQKLSWRAMEAAMVFFGSFSLGPHVKKHQHAILLCSASCLWRESEAFWLDPFHPFPSTTPALLLNGALSPNCGYITNTVTKWQPFSHFVN